MQKLLIEPAAYAIAENSDSQSLSDEFSQFYKSFLRLEKFVKLNEIQLVCSGEVYRRSQHLFPYASLSEDNRTENGLPQMVAQQLNIFLDQVATPFEEWEGRDEDILDVQPRVDPEPPLYRDTELRTAWWDLLAGCASSNENLFLMLVAPSRSFAPPDTSSVGITGKAKAYESIAALHLWRSMAGGNFLDVEPYEQLQARSPDPAVKVDIDYEDSGHHPPAPMKRALEQTAKEHRDLVSRMNTKRIVGNALVCKLMIPAEESGGSANHSQLEFTISDGDITYKGYFTTRATTVDQLQVALLLVRRTYMQKCERAGLKMG
jgi:hypothetical protein